MFNFETLPPSHLPTEGGFLMPAHVSLTAPRRCASMGSMARMPPVRRDVNPVCAARLEHNDLIRSASQVSTLPARCRAASVAGCAAGRGGLRSGGGGGASLGSAVFHCAPCLGAMGAAFPSAPHRPCPYHLSIPSLHLLALTGVPSLIPLLPPYAYSPLQISELVRAAYLAKNLDKIKAFITPQVRDKSPLTAALTDDGKGAGGCMFTIPGVLHSSGLLSHMASCPPQQAAGAAGQGHTGVES